MTQQRTDDQLDRLMLAAAICLKNHLRQKVPVKLSGDEMICTAEEITSVVDDLLSLRAAVRRVHAAEDAVVASRGRTCEQFLSLRHEMDEAKKALRAEMASIDGGSS